MARAKTKTKDVQDEAQSPQLAEQGKAVGRVRKGKTKKVQDEADDPQLDELEEEAAVGRGRKGTGKKLVIVESPAKAKTINRYLGDDYIVKASMGHVRDLPSKGLGIDLEHGFQPTYEMLATRKRVLAELRKYARTAPEIYLATDMDREGEAIAWHLAEALKLRPAQLHRVTFNEITKSAILDAFAHPQDINVNKVDAQQARRVLDRIVGYMVSPLLWRKVATGLSAGRVQTVAVRLIVDRERQIQVFMPEEYWRINAIFTPDQAAAAGLEKQWRGFLGAANAGGTGPTQVQQLAFLNDRKAFWAELVELSGKRFDCSNGDEALKAAEALGLSIERVERKDDAQAKGPAQHKVTVFGRLYGDSAKPLPAYTLEAINSRVSQTRPPPPFNTASLQQAASIQLRFSASRTMRLAQQLYEGVDVPGEGSVGLITYMRTDSLTLSPVAVEQVRGYIGQRFGPKYLPEKENIYRSGPRAQAAHEAIRPTDAARAPETLAGALEGDLRKLYELIWRRFVACQMTPAQWAVTEAQIGTEVSIDGHAVRALFKTSGRKLIFDGFLAVTGIGRSEEQILPELAQGQKVAPVELSPTQHFTQPPPRYTEASLVKALEAEGIGRPSTYASIIQTIQDRNYVMQLDRRFHATELGMKVVDKLVAAFPELFDLRFTAGMEDKLDAIEEAKTPWQGVVNDFYGPFKITLDLASTNMVHAKAESEPSEYTCETCGKPMVYRWSKNGRYLACTGYPECKTTAPVDEQGKKLERKVVDATCPNCAKPMMLRRSRFGPFLGCGDYPTCKGILPCDKDGNPLKVVKEEDIKENCPECGSPMAVKRKGMRSFLGCSRYPDCTATAQLPEGIRLERPPREKPQEAGVNCPKCKRPMVIRAGKRGPFLACSGYPRCRNAMDLSKLEELKAAQATEKK